MTINTCLETFFFFIFWVNYISILYFLGLLFNILFHYRTHTVSCIGINVKPINRFQHIKSKVNTLRKTSVPVTNSKLFINRHNVLPDIRRDSKQEKDLNKTNTNVYYLYYKDNRTKSPKKKRVENTQEIEQSNIMTSDELSIANDATNDNPRMAPTKAELTLELETIPSKSGSVKTTTRTQGENPLPNSSRRSSNVKDIENMFQQPSSRRNSIIKETDENDKPIKSRRKSVAFTIDEGEPNEERDDDMKNNNRMDRRNSSAKNESPFPMLMDHFATNPSHKVLTVKDMKELPLSTKFYPEASRMIYNTEGKSFIPKGHLSHLASMKRSREAEIKRQEEAFRKSREDIVSRELHEEE